MRDFAGKVAVVTGGASGIGLGMATRFAQEGMKVVLADIEEPVLEAAVTGLRQQEFDVIGIQTDVSRQEAVKELARKTIEAYGKVNVLCNNAGVGGSSAGGIWENSMKDWQWVMGVNLWGVVYGLHHILPLMLENGEEGHVVSTSSMAGLTPGTRIYSVTKHAVVALMEAVYFGLKARDAKVHASVLCPGIIDTNIMFSRRNRPEDLMNDPTKPATPEELARSQRVHELAMREGMPPAQLADIVVNAIRNEQFYILTHEYYDDNVRTRMEDILNRRNPSPYQSRLDRV